MPIPLQGLHDPMKERKKERERERERERENGSLNTYPVITPRESKLA